MFLVLKPKFKKCEQVWFFNSLVEKNPLGRAMKTLEEGTLGINTKGHTLTNKTPKRIVATQDRVFPHYVPNSSIKHSKSDSKDRSQEIL
jgi:hypothetical protein